LGVSPRLGLRWRVLEPLTLKAATGLFYRTPEEDEIFAPFGDAALGLERAFHVTGGAEWRILPALSLDVQAYWKRLDHLTRTVDDPADPRVYRNDARGQALGGEILLRHEWTDRLFGWVSYSFSRSTRDDGPGTPTRLFDQDQTHNLIAVVSWEFWKSWRLGARYQFTSGEPYTAIRGGVFNGDNGTYLPAYDASEHNGSRRAAWHRLDVRVDKRWVFDTWMLSVYLDVQNATAHANEFATAYNYDFTESGAVTDVPIWPSIGLRADF
jgi:hypothetical protein